MVGWNGDDGQNEALNEQRTLRGLTSVGIFAPLFTPSSTLMVAAMAGVATLTGLVYRYLRAGGAAGSSEATTASAPPLLTEEEEFVVDLLCDHGGRVRQSLVVERSPWSKSKVSRLLTGMEQKGFIEKVQVGRENAVVLTERSSESTR